MLASRVAVLDTVPQGLSIPCSKRQRTGMSGYVAHLTERLPRHKTLGSVLSTTQTRPDSACLLPSLTYLIVQDQPEVHEALSHLPPATVVICDGWTLLSILLLSKQQPHHPLLSPRAAQKAHLGSVCSSKKGIGREVLCRLQGALPAIRESSPSPTRPHCSVLRGARPQMHAKRMNEFYGNNIRGWCGERQRELCATGTQSRCKHICLS